MFRSFLRKVQSNPLEKILQKAQKKGSRKFLLIWNRGLGDIPLGLYAMIKRIKQCIPAAEITFLARDDLKEGFVLLEGVKFIAASGWKRHQKIDLLKTLKSLNMAFNNFDVVLKNPDPTWWVKWQIGYLVPRLKWQPQFDGLCRVFQLEEKYQYLGVQMKADSGHGRWRDWPEQRWLEFFRMLEKYPQIRVLLFGLEKTRSFAFSNVIDLRGKTTVLQMLSLIKNRCSYMVLPDGGILSLLYYLDVDFPLKIVSLWNDCQGVVKQNVASPNSLLQHLPLKTKGDLSAIEAEKVVSCLFCDKQKMSC